MWKWLQKSYVPSNTGTNVKLLSMKFEVEPYTEYDRMENSRKILTMSTDKNTCKLCAAESTLEINWILDPKFSAVVSNWQALGHYIFSLLFLCLNNSNLSHTRICFLLVFQFFLTFRILHLLSFCVFFFTFLASYCPMFSLHTMWEVHEEWCETPDVLKSTIFNAFIEWN